MRPVTVLLVGVVVVGGATPVAGGPGNDPPVVDAGLDQQVQRGATVLLDGTASRDPDGELEATTWRVEAPNGTVLEPDCPECARTTFEADRLGTYHVTLTAIDGEGATGTDRLEIHVVREYRPTVRLSGPDVVDYGESETYVATASIENESLGYIVWTVNGRRVATDTLSGRQATDRIEVDHGSVGGDAIRAVVYDREGQRASDVRSVTVLSPVTDPPTTPERPPSTTPATTPTPGESGAPTTGSGGNGGSAGGDGGLAAGSGGSPSNGSDSVDVSFDLNDARRTTWLVKKTPSPEGEDDPTEDVGVVIPTGWSPGGGGASGAVTIGDEEEEESPEYVDVLSHTALELSGQGTAGVGENDRIAYVGLGGFTAGDA
jgi:hypothetical protein